MRGSGKKINGGGCMYKKKKDCDLLSDNILISLIAINIDLNYILIFY
jgi:hypothetical protein